MVANSEIRSNNTFRWEEISAKTLTVKKKRKKKMILTPPTDQPSFLAMDPNWNKNSEMTDEEFKIQMARKLSEIQKKVENQHKPEK